MTDYQVAAVIAALWLRGSGSPEFPGTLSPVHRKEALEAACDLVERAKIVYHGAAPPPKDTPFQKD